MSTRECCCRAKIPTRAPDTIFTKPPSTWCEIITKGLVAIAGLVCGYIFYDDYSYYGDTTSLAIAIIGIWLGLWFLYMTVTAFFTQPVYYVYNSQGTESLSGNTPLLRSSSDIPIGGMKSI